MEDVQGQCLHLDHHTHSHNPPTGSLTQLHSCRDIPEETSQGPLVVQRWELWVNVPATSSDDLSSISKTHTVGEN